MSDEIEDMDGIGKLRIIKSMNYYIDTHSHLFLEEFKDDLNKVIERAQNHGIKNIILPNIDSSTIESLIMTCEKYNEVCLPTIGLHPTSVNENYQKELEIVEEWLRKFNNDKDTVSSKHISKNHFYAIGETGIDLYWDKTFIEEQKETFKRQLELSVRYELPIIIHSRNSLNEIFEIIETSISSKQNSKPRGVFHCFPGTKKQAQRAIDYGFKIGIGGVVTFKNSLMQEVVREIALESIVLETDSPYLSPVPHRGKRNESSYIPIIAEKTAQIKGVSTETVASVTTASAKELFNL